MDPPIPDRSDSGPHQDPDPFEGIDFKGLLRELLVCNPLIQEVIEKYRSPGTPRNSSPRKATPAVACQAKEPSSEAKDGPSAQTPMEFISNPLPGPSASTSKPTFVAEPHSETSPASSETDEFKTVQNKSQKRKLKASKSNGNPPKKLGLEIPSTSSRSQAPATQTPEEESEDSPMEGPRREKVPPLYIREKLSWQRILPILTEQNISFEDARSTAVGIRVACPSSADHRRLTNILREKNIGYHTYALPEERVLRVVIRGLPKELDTELIKADLLSQDLPVLNVHRMYDFRTRKPYEMVLVILELSPEGKKIHRIKSVCRLTGLRVQAPNNSGRMGQCHRCQLYGHSARNCFAQPRCVKCLGDHGTADCARIRSTTDLPSCVLCQTQGHPANYRGCKKAPKPKRRVNHNSHKPTTTKPVEKFVAAPIPAQNAWAKPLTRANVPASTPSQAPAAQPARQTPAAANLPAPPAPATSSDAASRVSENLVTLSIVLSTVNIEELDVFCKAVKKDALAALGAHSKFLISVQNLQKSVQNV